MKTKWHAAKEPMCQRNQRINKNTLRQMKMEIPHSKIDETQQKQL